jgi:hypothetical protein
VRPGIAIAEWDGKRYTPPASGRGFTDAGGSAPALGLAIGIDAAAGRHSVFDVTLSSYGFVREGKLTSAGALLFGYSYY